jgi:hypothetical protein
LTPAYRRLFYGLWDLDGPELAEASAATRGALEQLAQRVAALDVLARRLVAAAHGAEGPAAWWARVQERAAASAGAPGRVVRGPWDRNGSGR